MADNYIIPNIGTKGQFKFKEPFNDEKYENQELTITAVRSIKELRDSGIDVLTLVYLPVNLKESDFINDSSNSVPIVTLQATNGKYLNVPANRINGMPDTSGVKYQNMMLAINLGLLPLDLSLDTVKEVIKDSVYDSLGVTSDVAEVRSSGIMLVAKLKDVEFRKLLEGKKKVSVSYRTRYYQLKEQYDKLDKLYKDLEKYVLDQKGAQAD